MTLKFEVCSIFGNRVRDSIHFVVAVVGGVTLADVFLQHKQLLITTLGAFSKSADRRRMSCCISKQLCHLTNELSSVVPHCTD